MCSFLVAAAVLVIVPHRAAAQDGAGAVFAMTNAASNNQINAYTRREDGLLEFSAAFPTGGNGSGGTVDPLHSQGSLTLSADHRLLFAVNAGSGTVTAFAVDGASISLLDTEPTGGSMPTSVTQAGHLVYVLNAGGNGSVSGFRILGNGHLSPIKDSTHNLSGSATGPTDVIFSPNRQFLIVPESATNKIDVFRVFPNGTLSNPMVTDSAGAKPFAAVFAPRGALIVGNVSNTVSNTISSYQLNWNGSLHNISNALPTDGMATCWDGPLCIHSQCRQFDTLWNTGFYAGDVGAGSGRLFGFRIAGKQRNVAVIAFRIPFLSERNAGHAMQSAQWWL
ncbi:MAG TPA: beta-propeller fold lactonase family protein [Terracidiphilus sp.]|nr:beta-propeller fold lactonase family protein [Terracidiphilus sp.]